MLWDIAIAGAALLGAVALYKYAPKWWARLWSAETAIEDKVNEVKDRTTKN